MSNSVCFEEIVASNGKRIAHATLNKPSALNALDLDMIRLLMPQLQAWQQDPDIALVILDGAGDKAFCAGGDVVSMHQAMQKQPKEMPQSLQVFFSEEYQLDYLIHSYKKPFVLWGNGIVMGGGLGLMNGASHRIVTESSRIAMPEISIGLYPDVGGTWFLNKMPDGCGMFLGMTGASINASDALYTKLADYFVCHSQKANFIADLQTTDWQNSDQGDAANLSMLDALCLGYQENSVTELPASNVEAHQELISRATLGKNAAQISEQILAIELPDNRWMNRAQATLKAGSPITANIVFEQLQRGQDLSLAECFMLELVLSCRCGEFGEFQEGVRALLIDKEQQPNWRYPSIDAVPQDTLEWFFSSPWSSTEHPLAQLSASL